MIKKIRIQIAAVLLALIFLFIAFVYGSALFDMMMSIDNNADDVLTIISKGVELREGPDGRPALFVKPVFGDIDKEDLEEDYNRQESFCALAITSPDKTDISFIQKGDLYTSEEIEDLCAVILSSDANKGRYEGYYFIQETKGNATIISVIDKTAEWETLRNTALSMLLINLIGFAVTAIIVWVLTGFITKPILDAMEAKKRFISDASHELKTPLTIISANAEVLKEDVGDGNGWLNNIEAQTHRMQNLVQEMLQLSSLEEASTKVEKQRFSLSEIAESTVLPFDAIAFERGLHLTYDFDPDLHTQGDPDAFCKIVGTLTDNAIKYASDNGEVVITLKQYQNTAIFSVYNTGCGIRNEERKRVFERFYRSDESRTRATGGSGLGLSIAQATSKLNGWTLKLESEENVYTKFILTIKLSQ